jgi:tRNA A-37 threonylcarbamoyl transferase component Bud32
MKKNSSYIFQLASTRTILPDEFDLHLDNATDGKQLLHCLQTVRLVPGKRMVCRAHWQDQEVFAKLYFDSRGAKRNCQSEIKGLEALQKHSICAPRIIHKGTAEQGDMYVVLLQPVYKSQSLDTIWDQSKSKDDRLELLENIARILAKHHTVGLLQRDLHLKNFLLSEGEIYTLDGGDIQIKGKPLDLNSSLANLGLLFAQLLPENDIFVQPVLSAYLLERNLSIDPSQKKLLYSHITTCRQVRLKKYLKKIFRECTEFVCERSFNRYQICRRNYLSPELKILLNNPDASLSIPGTEILKDGNSSTVWLTTAGTQKLVVKRYNIKGFWHFLRRGFGLRRSRAAVSWKSAHMLKSYGVKTALPIAMVEERLGPLRRRAYFITEHLQEEDARYFFNQKFVTQKEMTLKAQEIIKMFHVLREYRIGHGDMKATNIIMMKEGPALIDLDSVTQFRSLFLFERRHQADLLRFLKNWQDMPDVKKLFLEIFPRNQSN